MIHLSPSEAAARITNWAQMLAGRVEARHAVKLDDEADRDMATLLTVEGILLHRLDPDKWKERIHDGD